MLSLAPVTAAATAEEHTHTDTLALAFHKAPLETIPLLLAANNSHTPAPAITTTMVKHPHPNTFALAKDPSHTVATAAALVTKSAAAMVPVQYPVSITMLFALHNLDTPTPSVTVTLLFSLDDPDSPSPLVPADTRTHTDTDTLSTAHNPTLATRLDPHSHTFTTPDNPAEFATAATFATTLATTFAATPLFPATMASMASMLTTMEHTDSNTSPLATDPAEAEAVSYTAPFHNSHSPSPAVSTTTPTPNADSHTALFAFDSSHNPTPAATTVFAAVAPTTTTAAATAATTASMTTVKHSDCNTLLATLDISDPIAVANSHKDAFATTSNVVGAFGPSPVVTANAAAETEFDALAFSHHPTISVMAFHTTFEEAAATIQDTDANSPSSTFDETELESVTDSLALSATCHIAITPAPSTTATTKSDTHTLTLADHITPLATFPLSVLTAFPTLAAMSAVSAMSAMSTDTPVMAPVASVVEHTHAHTLLALADVTVAETISNALTLHDFHSPAPMVTADVTSEADSHPLPLAENPSEAPPALEAAPATAAISTTAGTDSRETTSTALFDATRQSTAVDSDHTHSDTLSMATNPTPLEAIGNTLAFHYPPTKTPAITSNTATHTDADSPPTTTDPSPTKLLVMATTTLTNTTSQAKSPESLPTTPTGDVIRVEDTYSHSLTIPADRPVTIPVRNTSCTRILLLVSDKPAMTADTTTHTNGFLFPTTHYTHPLGTTTTPAFAQLFGTCSLPTTSFATATATESAQAALRLLTATTKNTSSTATSTDENTTC